MDKRVVMLGMVFGTTLGGYLPTLFNVDAFSFVSLLGSAVGGVIGIWFAYKIQN